MLAGFVSPLWAPRPRAYPLRRQARTGVYHQRIVAALEPQEPSPGPGFARGAEQEPQRSFLNEKKRTQQTATQRLRADIDSTLETLSQPARTSDEASARRRLVDISGVSPVNAAGGGAIALVMFSGLWFLTSVAMEFYSAHPGNQEIYVVQRISAVVRTIIITVLALGSGLSGITGCGLLALAARVTWGRATGEFDK